MLDENASAGLAESRGTMRQPDDTAHRPCGRLQWHVVSSLPNKQFAAEASLAADGWRVYHPLHLHRVRGHGLRIVSLFPGYLFVLFDVTGSDWPRICRARGVAALLGPPGRPSTVPAGLVEQLLARTSARRVVDDPLAPDGHVYLRPGASVAVLQGPLAGLEGICRLSAPERVQVLFQLLGRELAVELLPQQVMAI